MPSYKTYKKSSLQEIYLCRKSISAGNLSLQEILFAGNLSLQEIYLCRKSILEALDADKFEETN